MSIISDLRAALILSNGIEHRTIRLSEHWETVKEHFPEMEHLFELNIKDSESLKEIALKILIKFEED